MRKSTIIHPKEKDNEYACAYVCKGLYSIVKLDLVNISVLCNLCVMSFRIIYDYVSVF